MILGSKLTQFALQVRRFNRLVPIRAILQDVGIIQGFENSIFCPFHPDEFAGHKSGAIRDDGNVLYCFSERRAYRPYDVVKLKNRKMEEFRHLIEGEQDLTIATPTVIPYHVPDDLFYMVMRGELTVMDVAQILRERYGNRL